MLKNLDELRHIIKDVKRKKMAVVFAHDDAVMNAVNDACKLNIIEPILIGDSAIISKYIQELSLEPPYQIIEEQNPESATKIALDLVNAGEVELIMKGLIDTKILLKGVVNKEYGIREATLLSHVGIVSFPTLDRVLFATDGAMNIEPNVEEKIMLVQNAVFLAKRLGYHCPKVGMVSAVEKVNPKIKSTLDAKEVVDYFNKDANKGFLIDGPFAIDNLVSMESVHHKGIVSDVAGVADILVFPNLDGGNIFYKTSVFLASGDSAGIIIGAKVPIILTSRADSRISKLNSILLAVVNQDGLLAISH
ncbi:MAG: bifunctional enoyl-CoA hydratase/phosphate acetyltransferase [Firmicutes bacterium]|nr:bifunctional enoyl-CoA hydratase/phosphate acetyltransferase [Bacillota bacterium]